MFDLEYYISFQVTALQLGICIDFTLSNIIIKYWLQSLCCTISLYISYFIHNILYLLILYTCLAPFLLPPGNPQFGLYINESYFCFVMFIHPFVLFFIGAGGARVRVLCGPERILDQSQYTEFQIAPNLPLSRAPAMAALALFRCSTGSKLDYLPTAMHCAQQSDSLPQWGQQSMRGQSRHSTWARVRIGVVMGNWSESQAASIQFLHLALRVSKSAHILHEQNLSFLQTTASFIVLQTVTIRTVIPQFLSPKENNSMEVTQSSFKQKEFY